MIAASVRESATAPTVIHYTDAVDFGGAERMIVTLMAGLQAKRRSQVLVHHAGPDIRRLIAFAADLGIATWALPPMRGTGRLLATLDFVRQLRRQAPALFHAPLSSPTACRYGLIAARLAGLPVVATVQLFIPVRGARAVYPYRLLSLAVDRYIAVSRSVAREMEPLCLNASSKIRVVYNGVPVEQFEGDARSGVCEVGRPRVLTVARLHSQKGLPHLLRAATLLRDVRFLVAGDGPDRRALDDEARSLGLGEQVEFLGHRDDIPELLRTADVFVLPSLYEGLPVSVLEAMAAGTPVVATAIAGTEEAVVHGESGLLVPPGDPAAIAAAIQDVVSDAALARKLVTGGKARVRAMFSADHVADGVCEVYDQVRSGWRSRAGRRRGGGASSPVTVLRRQRR
jgi:glycosyltransferase involved in cell wall biosynthesis